LLIQLCGVAVTLVWPAGMTFIQRKLVSAFVPLRVSREHGLKGLDISQHGEARRPPLYFDTFNLPYS
jgi:ammonium transporter, Amt family